jgi:hypothetical protein
MLGREIRLGDHISRATEIMYLRILSGEQAGFSFYAEATVQQSHDASSAICSGLEGSIH